MFRGEAIRGAPRSLGCRFGTSFERGTFSFADDHCQQRFRTGSREDERVTGPFQRTLCFAILAMASALAQEPQWRHELRFGVDTDTFNYTDAAAAQTLALTSRWNRRWTTVLTSTTYQRFGADAERATVRVSRKLGSSSWISVLGGAGHDERVIPKREAGIELGHAMRVPGKHFVRGMELSYGQQWMWFTGAKVLVLSGSSFFYLPRDWTFTLSAMGARSTFRLPSVEWRPSGSARLGFPLHRRLRASLGFAVGTENFAKADEVGHFSARTFGGGVRYQLTDKQDVGVTVFYQDRSQSRSQTSVGVSYGIRF